MVDPATQQLAKGYKAVREYAKHGLHPEEYLTYDFLRKHPILLQPGMLWLDWNRIPGLTRRIATFQRWWFRTVCGAIGSPTGKTPGSRMKNLDILSGMWLSLSVGAGLMTIRIPGAETNGYIC